MEAKYAAAVSSPFRIHSLFLAKYWAFKANCLLSQLEADFGGPGMDFSSSLPASDSGLVDGVIAGAWETKSKFAGGISPGPSRSLSGV